METGIRVSKSTAARIKSFNKGNSYEDNIIAFLDYFERTGVNPWMLKEHPIEITMKGFDRTIAILKNIEKEKINKLVNSMGKLDAITDLLKPFVGYMQGEISKRGAGESIPKQEVVSVIGEGEDKVTMEELEALVSANENLNQTISGLTVTIDQLKEDLKKANSKVFTESSLDDFNSLQGKFDGVKRTIKDVIFTLEQCKTGSFSTDYVIGQMDFRVMVDTLKNMLL